MRIGIDGRWVSRKVGLGIFSQNLINELAVLDSKNNFIIYVSSDSDIQRLPNKKNFSYRVVAGPYPVAEQIIMPYLIWQDRIDVFHASLGTSPFLLSKVKLVLTLADVMFMMPENLVPRRQKTYQKLGSWYRKLVVPHSFKKSKSVVTISKKSKQDIQNYLASDKNVEVVYLAQGKDFKPLPGESTQKGEYFFALSATDPRKYTKELINSYLEANVKTPLVLAGTIDPSILKGLSPKITYAGKVNESRLVKLYQGAKFFIYPSLYEAFGIPLLEAMACGTPVLALKTGANPEIAEDGAYLVDEKDLSQAIKLLDSDEVLRANLQAKGSKRSKDFNWSKTAKGYLKIYKEAYQ